MAKTAVQTNSPPQKAFFSSLSSFQLQAVVVFEALAFGWQAIKMTFKPFLDKTLSAMDKSDLARVPDGDDDLADRQEKGSLSESDVFFSDENPAVA
jgi:hypothetical protein